MANFHIYLKMPYNETDFLITKDGKPWLPTQAKEARGPIESHHHKNRDILGDDGLEDGSVRIIAIQCHLLYDNFN
jgi:hypothetical protein